MGNVFVSQKPEKLMMIQTCGSDSRQSLDPFLATFKTVLPGAKCQIPAKFLYGWDTMRIG